jgi:ribosomal protein S18 acetylase RimI-like enzyme
MDATLTITSAKPDDVWDMAELLYRTWLVTYPSVELGITIADIEERFKDRHTPHQMAQHRERLASPMPGAATLVARRGDVVVGLCWAVAHRDRNQLHGLYVLPWHHRRGIGRALWREAQKCFNPGKPTLVEVADYNAPAIAFYASLGFVDTGKRLRNPMFIMKSGAIIPEMEMRRPPDAP